jgi:hypothetical protein
MFWGMNVVSSTKLHVIVVQGTGMGEEWAIRVPASGQRVAGVGESVGWLSAVM